MKKWSINKKCYSEIGWLRQDIRVRKWILNLLGCRFTFNQTLLSKLGLVRSWLSPAALPRSSLLNWRRSKRFSNTQIIKIKINTGGYAVENSSIQWFIGKQHRAAHWKVDYTVKHCLFIEIDVVWHKIVGLDNSRLEHKV